MLRCHADGCLQSIKDKCIRAKTELFGSVETSIEQVILKMTLSHLGAQSQVAIIGNFDSLD